MGAGVHGSSLLHPLLDPPGVELAAICDLDDNAADARRSHLLNPVLGEFDHPIWKMYCERTLRLGHGGADRMELHGWTESLRHGTPSPVSIVDAVTWNAIGPLSERATAGRSKSLEMPDSPKGKSKRNPKFELCGQWG